MVALGKILTLYNLRKNAMVVDCVGNISQIYNEKTQEKASWKHSIRSSKTKISRQEHYLWAKSATKGWWADLDPLAPPSIHTCSLGVLRSLNILLNSDYGTKSVGSNAYTSPLK
jgi:hypothetical protein